MACNSRDRQILENGRSSHVGANIIARERCFGRIRPLLRRRLEAVVELTALCCWVCSEWERYSRDHGMISRVGGGRRVLLFCETRPRKQQGGLPFPVFVVRYR